MISKTFTKLKKVSFGSIYDTLLSYIGGQQYLSIQFDITNACNLNCKHCYHSDHVNSSSLALTDWKVIIDQYEELCAKLRLKPFIVISGGEPLTCNLLLPIISYLNDKWNQVETMILTNGTNVTDQLMSDLSPYNVCFQVSIDGPDVKTHEEVRGKGSFSPTIEGINKLNDNGFKVSILAILSSRTQSFISKFFELAKELPIESFNFTRFIAEGNGNLYVKKGEDSPLPPVKLKEAYSQIVSHSGRTGIKTNTSQPLFHLLDAKLGGNGKFGFQGLVVDYRGNLKVSSRTNYVLGDLLKEGLENLFFNSPIMDDLRKDKIDKCGKCQHYRQCGGDRNAAFAVTKNFLSSDPGCWLIT